MALTVLHGSPPVQITLRRSARATRFSLRVSRVDGTVTLSLPRWAREAEALAFARDKEAWIRAALAARPVGRAVVMGGTVPVEGVEWTIRPGSGRAPRLEGGALMVPGDAARTGARVAAYLKVLARARLQEACDRHAVALGRRYSGLTLRDTKSRWGSCSADGGLMFSWRLVMAPPAVLDYVAAHEVAHLAEMNHSARFWAEVARLMPGYAAPRAWLKRHGQELHSLMFTE